jgi:hypothetical protein
MEVPEMVQLVTSLGFPIVLVLVFLVFFDKRIWPWFTGFMEGYVEVITKNTAAVQTMTSAIAAIADEVRAQPNVDLSRQTAVLMTRMDEQHIQLSQQMSALGTQLGQKIDMHMGYAKKNEANRS